jgi:flagellar basal body-associated protein FliL
MPLSEIDLNPILLGLLGTNEIIILLVLIVIIAVIVSVASKKADTNLISTPTPSTHRQNSNHQTVVIVNEGKSVGLAFLLAFLFGPLGLLYASVVGGIIMIVLSIIIGAMTLGAGLIITWIISIVWAVIAAGDSKQNSTTVVTHSESNIPGANAEANRMAPSSNNRESLLNQLSQLHTLKEKGVLTEEIYETERQIILGKLANAVQ